MAGDSFADYSRLPEFTGPNMLPEANMSYIVYRLRPHLSYCKVFFLRKLHTWCKYIKQLDAKKAMNEQSGCAVNGSEVLNGTFQDLPKLCYDDFFCSTEIIDYPIYLLMILNCIFISFGVVAAMVLVGTFIRRSPYSHINKSSFTIYIAPTLFFHVSYLIIGLHVYAVSGLQKSVKNQTEAYINYSLVSIPYLLPLMDLSFQLVAWYISMLIINNYWSLTCPSYSRKMKVIHFIRNTIIIFICFAIYTAPKFLYFTVRQNEDTNQDQVTLELGSVPQFKYMLNWLKMTFEYLIPLVLLAVFLSLFRTHDKSSKSKRHSEIQKEMLPYWQAFNRIGTVLAICLGLKIGFHLTNGVFDGIPWMNYFLKNLEFTCLSLLIAIWPLSLLVSYHRILSDSMKL